MFDPPHEESADRPPRRRPRIARQGRLPTEVTRILLAEDDIEMGRLIEDTLEARGYEVQVLHDGARMRAHVEAVLEGRRAVPDLIISDIRMPGASGLEVLDVLRRTDWATPVVLITAFGDAPTHAEARRLGAVTVLDKPFELDDLAAVVLSQLPPRL